MGPTCDDRSQQFDTAKLQTNHLAQYSSRMS